MSSNAIRFTIRDLSPPSIKARVSSAAASALKAPRPFTDPGWIHARSNSLDEAGAVAVGNHPRIRHGRALPAGRTAKAIAGRRSRLISRRA